VVGHAWTMSKRRARARAARRRRERARGRGKCGVAAMRDAGIGRRRREERFACSPRHYARRRCCARWWSGCEPALPTDVPRAAGEVAQRARAPRGGCARPPPHRCAPVRLLENVRVSALLAAPERAYAWQLDCFGFGGARERDSSFGLWRGATGDVRGGVGVLR
jgi:hypothetical protein